MIRMADEEPGPAGKTPYIFKAEKNMSLNPLGIVKEILEEIGIEISYAYDDLIFVNHNAFLLKFSGNNGNILLHVNSEADEEVIKNSITTMNNACALRKMKMQIGKYYTLKQTDKENVRLEFKDMKPALCFGCSRK
jgi:hypothetical protein